MKYIKIMILAIFLVSLLAVSAVSATDNVTDDIVSVEEITNYPIGDATNQVVIVDDNSTQDIDFDLLEGEGYEIDKNTVNFNLNELNVPYYENDYYIFDYDDGGNTKELSSHWVETHTYSYDLNLTKNSNYSYTFYGHTTIVGHLHARPWTYGQYSDSNLILQGSFKTDNYGNIIDFNHDQHLKLVLSNYNNSCIIVSMSKPFANSYNLNGEYVGLSKGKKLNTGMNIIEETYQNNNYIQNYVKKTFNIFVHDNSGMKTFTELAAKINSGESEIVLDSDYKYNSSIDFDYQSGVEINKPITIDGQGHILDGNNVSRIFQVSANKVILRNINFINSQSTHYGTVYWVGDNGVLYNCSFVNCSSLKTYSALGWSGNDGVLHDCNFVNCSSNSCGAVCWDGDNGVLHDCNFVNCSTSSNGNQGKGGAIYLHSVNSTLRDSNFVNCFAYHRSNDYYDSYACCGGALYIYCGFWDPNDNSKFSQDNISFSGCTFVNCNSPEYGGAVYIDGGIWDEYGMDRSSCYYISISDCYFMNCSAGEGSSIYWSCPYGLILDSTFSNCHDVIYLFNEYQMENKFDVLINGSNFCNNSNGSIYCNGNCINVVVNNSWFDNNHQDCYVEKGSLIIFKRISEIFVDDFTCYYNNATFKAGLKSNDVGLINNVLIFNFTKGNITKTFRKYTNNEGLVLLTDDLNSLGSGIWKINIIFEGNDNYYPSNSTVTLTIIPENSELVVNDINSTFGQEVIITVNVVSSNNLTINEGVVSFFDGETNIGEANVVDGVAALTYTPATAGEHPITVRYYSDNYDDSINSALLTVAKAGVDLNIDYINDVYYTNPSNFAININSNSKPVNEGKIKYYVNNELVGTVDVYEGTANFDYVTDAIGSFTLTAAYEETDNYFAKNASTTFTVNKMPTTLSGESVIFDEESYKTFTTELKDDNSNGVSGQPVKIEVIKYSGESATFNGISDANGITVYDVGRLAGGMWYVTGVYAGNDNYIESRFVDKFLVVRMNTTTEIEEIDNPKVNHNYKLKANIHDENGKLVKEGIVQFYLDGVDIGSIDLSNNQGHQSSSGDDVLGVANPMFEYVLGADNDVSDLYINYVPTKAGKHTLTAVYDGTTIYKASNSTTSFDVSNSNTVETTITAADVTTVYNGGKYIVIKLTDVNGKLVNGVKVKVVLNKKTYTPTTKNGQVKISTNGLAPVKTYAAKITFAGNSKYDKATKSVKVSVKKATPKLTAKAKTFKKSVKTKNFVVTLKTNQNKVMKNTKVTLKVNGKTYSAKTNSKGQATFKITKLTKKGKYTATIKYAGNKYYNAKSVKAKITVK